MSVLNKRLKKRKPVLINGWNWIPKNARLKCFWNG
ncbi:hypothetical protein BMETH_1133_0 [methanotrophic bacterial endosymbiont of Bathymodiolus sp.]|nr:hypothetical protein BMETH_1133_0 [methanotrophic bacterial endosymbiont of Bathymodiolus sp.]